MSSKQPVSLRNLFEGMGLTPETVAAKAKPEKKPKPRKPETVLTPLPAAAFADAIRPEDVGYTHPVLMQCFLPVRHTKTNADRHQTNCGRASLVIRAGELVKPDAPNTFKQCLVPAGPKARLISAYVNDFIHSYRTPVVPLGDSMRKAMEKMGIPIGGKNGEELARELENFAAAEIILGVWDADGSAHQRKAAVSEEFSFWIERDPNQRTFWQPEMTVSQRYYAAITERDMTPFHWPALIELSHNARAMDIHAFLTYRLHRGLKKPVPLRREVLHAMFGQGVKSEKQFWPEFKKALLVAHKQYPTARIEVTKDSKGNETGILLKDSPPLIPYRKLAKL